VGLSFGPRDPRATRTHQNLGKNGAWRQFHATTGRFLSQVAPAGRGGYHFALASSCPVRVLPGVAGGHKDGDARYQRHVLLLRSLEAVAPLRLSPGSDRHGACLVQGSVEKVSGSVHNALVDRPSIDTAVSVAQLRLRLPPRIGAYCQKRVMADVR
jgi:hypothetical protein